MLSKPFRPALAALILCLVVAAPARARPWTLGGGGGFQMNQYQVDEFDAFAFLPNGTVSVFAETPLAPAVVLRAVGAYAWYVQEAMTVVSFSGSSRRPSLGVASLGPTLRLRVPGRQRTAPYVEAGPVLCWSRWHDQPYGYLTGSRAGRASKLLPGLQWSAGFEVRPGERARMEFGVTGLVTGAPREVDLPSLSGEWVRGLRQFALSASVGWKI